MIRLRAASEPVSNLRAARSDSGDIVGDTWSTIFRGLPMGDLMDPIHIGEDMVMTQSGSWFRGVAKPTSASQAKSSKRMGKKASFWSTRRWENSRFSTCVSMCRAGGM